MKEAKILCAQFSSQQWIFRIHDLWELEHGNKQELLSSGLITFVTHGWKTWMDGWMDVDLRLVQDTQADWPQWLWTRPDGISMGRVALLKQYNDNLYFYLFSFIGFCQYMHNMFSKSGYDSLMIYFTWICNFRPQVKIITRKVQPVKQIENQYNCL